jgi:hypothetical protein
VIFLPNPSILLSHERIQSINIQSMFVRYVLPTTKVCNLKNYIMMNIHAYDTSANGSIGKAM